MEYASATPLAPWDTPIKQPAAEGEHQRDLQASYDQAKCIEQPAQRICDCED
jgi:hypothetical protein